MSKMEKPKCHLCGKSNSTPVSTIKKKPGLETDYGIQPANYYREIRLCKVCGAYFNSFDSDLIPADFYRGKYNASIEEGDLEARFNRIINLPIAQSDNKQRVQRILNFLKNQSFDPMSVDVLDVGSGTGVFLHELSKYIQNIYGVDPDPASVSLMRKKIGSISAWNGTLIDIPRTSHFDLITFNKVLEHVNEPIKMLVDAKLYLKPSGFIYIELPFADNLISNKEQDSKAEFFLEHLVIYNRSSLSYLVKQSGFDLIQMEDLVEPSGKNTISAFVKPSGDDK